MIRAALGLELRTLARSPSRLIVLLLTLGTGLFVLVQGQRDVARWEDAIAAARAQQEETRDKALEHFAAGRVGPENRPWVDLTRPLWQDWYAATRLVREPAPLAGIAFASLETDAVAVRISRLTDPLLAQGADIDNPELEAAGGLDLVTVLALLMPLMVLALGVEVGGHERASGILPLIRVQSGRDRGWLGARCAAVGAITGATGLALVISAAQMMQLELGSVLLLGALVIAYAAFWTTLLAAVALCARHPAQGAVALGAAWMALCVLVPAIGVERAAALAAEDFAVDLTIEARDAADVYEGLEDEAVFALLLRRWPDLEGLLPSERPSVSFVEREGLGLIALEKRMERREALDRVQARLVDRMSLASPAIAFTRALEALAGRGPQAAVDHRRAVVRAVADRIERHIAGKWRGDELGVEDFKELLASTPERVPSRVEHPMRELMILLVWTLGLALSSAWLSRPRARCASPETSQRAHLA